MATYRDLQKGHVNWLVPSRLEELVSGVRHVKQARNGVIEVTYVDGSTESASMPDVEITDLELGAVVSAVQSQRAP